MLQHTVQCVNIVNASMCVYMYIWRIGDCVQDVLGYGVDMSGDAADVCGYTVAIHTRNSIRAPNIIAAAQTQGYFTRSCTAAQVLSAGLPSTFHNTHLK